MPIRPSNFPSRQRQRAARTNRAKKVQTTIAHDETAIIFDPHLGLRLKSYVWPFMLIALRMAPTLSRHRLILTGSEDEKIDHIVAPTTLVLAVLIFGAAVLYSSVGHAGASGYLAVMALFGLAPEVIKPTALTLNIAVALITTVRFYRAGHFSWSLSWPFLALSIPLAFVGGAVTLPGTVYRFLVGLVLLFAAYRLFWYTDRESTSGAPPHPSALDPLRPVHGFGKGPRRRTQASPRAFQAVRPSPRPAVARATAPTGSGHRTSTGSHSG